MLTLFVTAIAAVLTFTGSTVFADTTTGHATTDHTTKVAVEPTCCCATVNLHGHQFHFRWEQLLKTKKGKARVRVDLAMQETKARVQNYKDYI